MKKVYPVLIWGTLLAAISFFAFYKLTTFYHFAYDQERDYQIVKSIFIEHKFTLIGPRAVSATGFYLGPWYYYLLVPFYKLFNQDPLFAAYLAGIVHLITSLYLYFLVSRRANMLAGVCAALIWSTVLHRTAWNVMFIPLFSLIIFDLFTTRPISKRLYLSAIIIALGINFHFQMIFFLPLFLLIMRPSLKQSPLSLFVFLIPFFPLILFDLRHQFVNIHSFLTFSGTNINAPFNLLSQLFFSLTQFVREFSFVIPGPQALQYYYVFLTIIFISFTLRKNIELLSLLLLPVFSIIALGTYTTPHWPEYYHLAGAVILLTLFVISLSKYKLGYLLLLLITIINVYQASSYLLKNDDPLGYIHQRQLMLSLLNNSAPNRPNITYDFPFGEGLGFGSIRDYYEDKTGQFGSHHYFIGYSFNSKHNSTKATFGAYAYSKN